MPASRSRILVPVLLLLVLTAVVAGLLVGNRTGADDGAAPTPSPSGSAPGAAPAPGATDDDVASPPGATDDDVASPPGAPNDAPDFLRRIEGDPMAAGDLDAPVGVVVYSDFSCPYCQQWAHETQPTVLEYAANGQVRVEWRDVNILGEDSTRAAVAAAAAAQQGRYVEYQELLFADLQARSPEQLTAHAAELGLDVEQFTADLSSPAVLTTVQQNIQEAQAVSLQSTPSFLVDGTPVVGAQPTDVFVELIDLALADSA